MKQEVQQALEVLRLQFPNATVSSEPDGQGGAYFCIEPVDIGPRYRPTQTWIAGQITNAYPYADIYPLFAGGDVFRADGRGFTAPITSGHQYRGRNALQISRINRQAGSRLQTAAQKVAKVLHFMRQEYE